MRALALVDYDNVRLQKERTAADVEYNATRLIETLVGAIRSEMPDVVEVAVRMYGGWVCEAGTFSRNGEWLLAILPNLRGLRFGLRVLPTLVTSPACLPQEMLVGTVRLRSLPYRQKMVDVLLAVDAMHFAEEGGARVLIVSDDDDLVPCALAVAARAETQLLLLRRRPCGDGLNDEALQRNGARIELLRRR